MSGNEKLYQNDRVRLADVTIPCVFSTLYRIDWSSKNSMVEKQALQQDTATSSMDSWKSDAFTMSVLISRFRDTRVRADVTFLME